MQSCLQYPWFTESIGVSRQLCLVPWCNEGTVVDSPVSSIPGLMKVPEYAVLCLVFMVCRKYRSKQSCLYDPWFTKGIGVSSPVFIIPGLLKVSEYAVLSLVSLVY